MPALMKINLLNTKASARMNDASSKPVMVKSKLKRIFERQFPGVLRNSCVENPPSQALSRVFPDPRPPGESSGLHDNNNNTNDNNLNVPRTASNYFGGSGSYHEPSSLCLTEMVYDFMENGGKNSDCGRARCNWFNGLYSGDGNGDSGDDPKSAFAPGEVCDILKSIVSCASIWERNLLADVSKLVEAVSHEGNTVCKDKEDCTNGCLRRAVMNRLRSSGYNAAVCKSRWDHTNGYPSGEYEYIDVIVEGSMGKSERLIVDIDFRSQFQIARSTGHYGAVLNMLPVIFVGKEDRLQQIVGIVCDAAKQSLKKEGLHIPPWRRFEYMRAKWLSPYRRTTNEAPHASLNINEAPHSSSEKTDINKEVTSIAVKGSGWGSRFTSEFELQFRSNGIPRHQMKEINRRDKVVKDNHPIPPPDDQITVVVSEWQPPAVKPKALQRGGKKIATGLASMLREAGLSSKS